MQAIIRGKIDVVTMVYTNTWRGYDGRVDVDFDRHFRVRHDHNRFGDGAAYTNGIESCWHFAKAHLQQVKSVPKPLFLLHLKAIAFRFNYRYEDLYKLLLKLLHQQPR